MKKLLVLVTIPLLLFGLERVNLIKNHSFEKEDSSWKAYTGTLQYIENDSAVANTHDSGAFCDGFYSASAYTSSIPGDPTPPGLMLDSAVVIQGFPLNKALKDLDSISWRMKVLPPSGGFDKENMVCIGIFFNRDLPTWIWGVYSFYCPALGSWSDNAHRKTFNFELTNDTSWMLLKRSLKVDWIDTRGLSPDDIMDSLSLSGYGAFTSSWIGQKAYWDDVRLTGYADYDVGIKGIVSGDSVKSSTAYTPTAHIKNFGRKAADSFLVIAEIKGGSGTVYADTLTWSLLADTEDTLSFKEFKPSDAANYTLTVSTIMTPDESDEDDAMSKTLYGSGIEETPSPSSLQLEVVSLSSIRYSIPSGEQGTISLYDPTGRRVESLRVEGSGQVSFKVGLASGVYFVKLESGKAAVTKKAVVLR